MDIALAFVNVGSVIWTIGKGLQEGGLLLATWFEKIGVVSSAFFKIAGFGEKILSVFGMVVSPFLKIGALIGTWAPFVLKFVSPFLKILGPIGWIITAFQAISGFMRGMQNGGGFLGGLKGAFVAVIPFGDKILQFLSFMWEKIGPIGRFIFKWLTPLGLMIQGVKYLANLFKNIGPGILEGLLAPFKAAWDWIKGIFVGKSPSNLGLGIVKGIMSVQAMLFDAITYPWRHALAWIADKIPGMGKVADKLRGGFGGLTNSVEAKAAESPTVASQITPKPTTLANTPQTVAAKTGADAAVAQDSSTKVLDDILMAIKTLNSNLESGKIGFYVDGQLLSATIARQTEFRGGYGVNKL